MENTVIIMRGPSGSSKSTYVSKNFPGAYVCSADHYFINDLTGIVNRIDEDIGLTWVWLFGIIS